MKKQQTEGFKWLRIEISHFRDYVQGMRYIVITYRFLGIPIFKKFVNWN